MLTEDEIVRGCKQLNKTAQMTLYKKYVGKMNAVCYRYVNSYDDAKDITQDGFLKVFASIGKYKGEGSLEGWIKRIMINLAIDYIKKKKSHSFVSLQEENTDDESASESIDPEYGQDDSASLMNGDFTADELMGIIHQLPEAYRIIFNMHCLENYSHKEIADILTIKEDTSRSRLRRARKILKENLATLAKHKMSLPKQNQNAEHAS